VLLWKPFWKTRLEICIYKTSLPHRPMTMLVLHQAALPTFYNKIVPMLPCAWKSLICVACLVFLFSLLWPTLLTCSGCASVTATLFEPCQTFCLYSYFTNLLNGSVSLPSPANSLLGLLCCSNCIHFCPHTAMSCITSGKANAVEWLLSMPALREVVISVLNICYASWAYNFDGSPFYILFQKVSGLGLTLRVHI